MIRTDKQVYLVGEPIFQPPWPSRFPAPVGQVSVYQQVLKESTGGEKVIDKLRMEYLTIVLALQEMGIEFQVIFGHQGKIDFEAGGCLKGSGCDLVSCLSEYFPESPQALIFPRDWVTVLPGIILFNPVFSRIGKHQIGDWTIVSSPCGEGGRLLIRQSTVLIAQKIVSDKGQLVEPEGLEVIREAGFSIGMLPPFLLSYYNINQQRLATSMNDHLGRTACLLEDQQGILHLVIDPGMRTRSKEGAELSPNQTFEQVQRACEPLEIKVHRPKAMEVPYSLNLLQFPDRRVLMTGGDDSVAETVADIVGFELITQTEVPIRFFPVWLYAGIRCLVSEAPTPILMKL